MQQLDEKQVLAQTANTLLNEPTIVTIDILKPNRLQKILIWFRIINAYRTFKITAACLDTMIRISKILLSIDFNCYKETESYIRTNYELMSAHSRNLCTVIALAANNGPGDPSESDIDFLCYNLTPAEVKKILMIVLHKLNIEDFMISIMSIQGMSLLNPKE